MSPLVSVITPLHNSAKFMESTIESVLNQSCSNWELLLVDDCSTDNSLAIARAYATKNPRIRVLRTKENSGAAVARNKAISAAKGRYLAFLDSDDRWAPDKLDKQLRFMRENSVDFCYTAYEKISPAGDEAGRIGVPDRVSYSDLLKVCSIGCLTAIYDTRNLGKIYMPLIRKRQDLGLWLRILKKIPYAYGLNESLAFYQLRDDSISANKKVAAQYTWRLYREIEGLSLIKATYYFSCYAINGLLRSKAPKIARKLGALR